MKRLVMLVFLLSAAVVAAQRLKLPDPPKPKGGWVLDPTPRFIKTDGGTTVLGFCQYGGNRCFSLDGGQLW